MQSAPNVCQACKARKKACDKILPKCGSCSARRQSCRYEIYSSTANRRAYNPGRDFVVLPVPPEATVAIRPNSTAIQIAQLGELPMPYSSMVGDSVFQHTERIMDALDVSVNELGERYFHRFSDWLPVLSPSTYYDWSSRSSLTTLDDDVCILILSMCLLLSFSELTAPKKISTFTSTRSLYVSVKSLFSRVQLGVSASLPLLRAGLLLAECELACGCPRVAYVTTASCAAMARVLGFHGSLSETTITANGEIPAASVNLIWSLAMLERYAS